MDATYKKIEKLKSKKLIGQLFAEGKSVSVYPLRLMYLKTEFTDGAKVKTGVSVPKRQFKKAVDRIRIKRLLREAYRLNKAQYFSNTSSCYAFMILYVGKEGTTFEAVDSKMKRLFELFLKKQRYNLGNN